MGFRKDPAPVDCPCCSILAALREGEGVRFSDNPNIQPDDDDIKIVGKVMLVGSVVKVNLGGKTSIMHSFGSEEGRMQAFKYYFDITLMEQEAQSIRGWDKALG